MLKNKRIVFLLRVFFHVFLGLLVGGGLITLYVSSNGTLQRYVEEQLQQKFKKRYQCDFRCKLETIQWSSLRMFFSQIQIKPQSDTQDNQEDWSIVADRLVVSCSWWSLLTTFSFKISGEFDHMIMRESYDHDAIKIFNFLKKLFVKEPGDMLQYDWMAITDGLLMLSQKQNGLSVEIPYMCNMGCQPDSTRMQLYTKDGTVLYNNSMLLNGISGSLVWDIPSKDFVKNTHVQLHMNMNIVPFGQKGHCSLTGSMRYGLGSFLCTNEDQSFVISPIQIRADSKKCLFDVSVILNSDLGKQLDMYDAFQNMQGSVQIDCRGDLYDFIETLLIDVSIEDVAYKTREILKDGKIFVQYKKSGVVTGQLVFQDQQWFEFVAQLQGSNLAFDFFNSKDLTISSYAHWKIPARQCVIQLLSDTEQGFRGLYKIAVTNSKLHIEKNITGTFGVNGNELSMSGDVDGVVYDMIMQLHPMMLLKKVLFAEGQKVYVDIHADEDDDSRLWGKVDFACIKNLVSDTFKSSFAQEGAVELQGYINNGVYDLEVATHNANIRIPRIYNVVQNVTASCEVDMFNRSVKFRDIKAELHEGEIVCSQANLFFDRFGSCFFVHVPLLLHNVLLSWDKGIFILLSGGLFLHKSEHNPVQLSGQLIVEKSQLKENLFSQEFQEKLFGKALDYNGKGGFEVPCELDVSIITKDLLQVKTSFLSAKARLDVTLQGTLKKPELSGLLQLVSGSFYFPYKSLDIIDGKVFFVPDQQFDPLIEVLARGKLKRYGITMRVAGSVFDPYVQFEAAPYLTEEQIMSLLLIGIEDSSLSVMLPALLTQRFKEMVFGPAIAKSTLQTRFERFMESFKYFRFLPQFTSQFGRGGMRGIFEIDASDHLHGKIDMNFMHLEDTRFDVDFMMTDDVTFRVQKDGPSTYGGEVELRWRFG